MTPIVWTTTYTFEDGSVDESAYANGYAASTVALIIFMLGTPLNSWVISAILYKRLYNVAALIPMLSLALSNLMLCILILPFIIISGYSREFIFGSSDYVRCKVCALGVANVTLPCVSIFNLTLMSVGKLLYLKFPLKYDRIFTPKRTAIISLILWVISILLALPPLFGFGTVSYSYAAATCTLVVIGGGSETSPVYYYVLMLSAIVVIPLSALTLMYVWILLIVRKYILRSRARFAKINTIVSTQRSMPENGEHRKKIKQMRMIRVLGVIILANIITWSPVLILGITGAITGPGVLPTPLFSVSYLMFLSEVVIHPLVQIILIYELRETVIMILTKLKNSKLFHFCI